MTNSTRFARSDAADHEVPICVLTVPVLAKAGQDAAPTAPVIEVYASTRARPVEDVLEVRCGTSPGLGAWAEASLARAVSKAYEATCLAARGAQLAKQGDVSCDEAEAIADSAESARVQAAELAITSALAEHDRLAARKATLDRQIAHADMRASVASLLMTHGAEVGGVVNSPQTPMFTLVHDGVKALQADVFEKDLLRLVSGQDMTLTVTSAANSSIGITGIGNLIIELRARLRPARAPTRSPSSVVRGMFLTAELLTGEGENRAVPGPTTVGNRDTLATPGSTAHGDRRFKTSSSLTSAGSVSHDQAV